MRWLRWTLSVVAVLALVGFGLAWWVLRRSLPQLEGEIAAASLSAPATIARDARGIPVITAASRADLAFATGFAHGQDRFFQMDLSRRLAAGELSELFGPVALATDTRTRRFGFRAVARRVMETAAPVERALVEAYARGVNAGRASLATRPWEYLLLRATPRDWAPEDSVLVVHSMWWQLQYNTLTSELDRRRFERAAGAQAKDAGGGEAAHALVAFAYAGHTEWDTPNYGSGEQCAGCGAEQAAVTVPYPALLKFSGPPDATGEEPKLPGSNGWAVAGAHTKSGAALVANDMHLDLGVPAVWYPARLRLPGAAGADSGALDITGVTLPGAPALIAGSNGHIAWGFTNSYGDFSDVRWGPCTSPDYRVRTEHIAVRGRDDDFVVEYREAGTGVVLDGDAYAADVKTGTCAQVGWLARYPEATNFALLGFESARTVDDALALAPGVGIPAQNVVLGDSGGRIAWALLGRVPRARGADRYFGALEFTDAGDHPRIADPPVGRLWTANQRVVGEPRLEGVLGDDEVDVGAGGYDLGARARQIRDDLVGLSHPATEADMLAIQTDSRGLFVVRWREQLLALLDEAALRDAPARREFRELVSGGKLDAVPDSAAYRLVRAWRGNVLDALWHSLATGLMGTPTADVKMVRRPAQFEAAGFRLVSERPPAIAPPALAPGAKPDADAWRAFLLARVDATIATLAKECGALAKCTYGAGKPVEIRHPLSRAVPLLSGLLDMPTRELPGDHHMPRVQDGPFGASERFAVTPGREAEGYLELPGGPSGHPLSPFYRSGFDDWVACRPTPFLPGPAAHTLALRP